MVKKSFFRPVCFILAETFLWTTLAFPQDLLRPTASREKEVTGIRADLTQNARDAASRIHLGNPVPIVQGISKQEIFFGEEKVSAKGRILLLDPRQVKIEQRYLPEAVEFDIAPDIPPGHPEFKWMPGLTLQEFVAREAVTPLAAMNSLQSNFKVKNGFLITDGKLVAKPQEARGIWQRGQMKLDGIFSVFVLDEGRLGIQQVEIKDDQLVTQGIREAISGPPLLLDGKDVSGQVRMGTPVLEGEEGPGAKEDEVPWDAKVTRTSWSGIGVNQEGKIVLVSLFGNELQDKRPLVEEPLVTDFAKVLQEFKVRDAILLGGRGDVQQYLWGDERPLVAVPGKHSQTKEQVPRKLSAALLVYAKDGGIHDFREWTPKDAEAHIRGWAELNLKQKEQVLQQLSDFNIDVHEFLKRIGAIGTSAVRSPPPGGYAFPKVTPLSGGLIAKGKEEIGRLAVLIVAGGAGSRFYGPAKENTEVARHFREFQGATVTEEQIDELAERHGKMTVPLTKVAHKGSLQLILEAVVGIDPRIPVVIGVGPDTKEHIETLLRENKNFGLENVRITEDDPNIVVDLDKKIVLTPDQDVFLATEGGAGTLQSLRKPIEGVSSFDWLKRLGRDQLLIFNGDNPGLPLDILYGTLGLALEKEADIIGIGFKYPKEIKYKDNNPELGPELDEFGLTKPKIPRGTFVNEKDAEGREKTVIVEFAERSKALRQEIQKWEGDPERFVYANAGVYFLSLRAAQQIVAHGDFKWHAPKRPLQIKGVSGSKESFEGHRLERYNPDIFEILYDLRNGRMKTAILGVEEQEIVAMKDIAEWDKAQHNVEVRNQKFLLTIAPDLKIEEGAAVEVNPKFGGTIGKGVVIEKGAKVYFGEGNVHIPVQAHLKGELFFENGEVYHSPDANWDTILRQKWEETLRQSALLTARKEKPPIYYNPEKDVEERIMAPYQIRLIPGRVVAKISRTTVPTAQVRTTQPFDPSALNFNHVNPQEILDRLFLRGRRYRVITNINPVHGPHVLIHVPEEKAQYFEPGEQAHIEAMLALQQTSELRIFFNGINAGATKNHFHFHGFYHPFPVESREVKKVIQMGEVMIGRLKDWPAQNIVLQSTKLEHLAYFTMQFINLLMAKNIPHNLLFLKDRVIVYLGSDDPKNLEGVLQDVDFATIELSGKLVALSKEIFDDLSPRKIENAMKRRTLSPEKAEQILAEFISIMSQQKFFASDGGIRFHLEKPEAAFYQFLKRELEKPEVLTKILKGFDPRLSSKDVSEVDLRYLHAFADTGDTPFDSYWYVREMTIQLKDGRSLKAAIKISGPWLSPSETRELTRWNLSAHQRIDRASKGIIPKLLYFTRVRDKEMDPDKEIFIEVVEYIPFEHGLFDEVKLFEKAILFWKASHPNIKNRYLPGSLSGPGEAHFFRKEDGQIDARILEMTWQKGLPTEKALLEELASDAKDLNHLFHAVLMALGREEGIKLLEKVKKKIDPSSTMASALTAYLGKADFYTHYLSIPEFHLILTAYQEIESAIRAVEVRRNPIGGKRRRSIREAILEEVESIRWIVTIAEKLNIKIEGKAYTKIKEELLNILFGREGFIDGRDAGFVGKAYVPGMFTFSTRHRHPAFEKDVLRIFAYHDWVAGSVARKLTKDVAQQKAFVRLYRSIRGMTDLDDQRVADRLTPEESQKLIYDLARIYFGKGTDDASVNAFKNENRTINTLALKLVKEHTQRLSLFIPQEEILGWLSLKVAANVLDLTHQKYGEAYQREGLQFFRDHLDEASTSRPFLISDTGEFLTQLYDRPRLVSWDLDNNGEVVFDLYLIQRILNHWEEIPGGENGKIVVVPKSLPVSNDATVQDVEGLLSNSLFKELKRARKEGRFEVLKEGPRIQGSDYTRLSKEQAQLYEMLLAEEGLLVKNGEAQTFTAPRGGKTPDMLYLYQVKGLTARRLGPFDRHLYGNEPNIIHFVPGKLLSQGVSFVEGDYPVITQTQQAFHTARTADLPVIASHLGDTEKAISALLGQMEESGETFAEAAADLARLYRSPTAAILLAGGKGTGLQATEEEPKPIVEVAGKPAALHFLDVAESMEIPTVVVVGFGAKQVRQVLGEKDHIYVAQNEQRGTGHAVLQARELLKNYKGNLLVAMGDLIGYNEWTIEDLQRAHAPPSKEGKVVALTLSTKILENPQGKGRIVRDSQGNIVGNVEQKDIDQLIKEDGYLEIGGIVLSGKQLDEIKEAITGFYLFDNQILFEILPHIKPSPITGEFYLTDAISLLVKKGYEIRAVPLLNPKQISGITTPKDIADREGEIQKERLEGPASIGSLYQEFLRATGRKGFLETLGDPEEGPVITMLGGGSGPASLTRGLSSYTTNSYHVITVFDSGGSTGILRHQLALPAVGDTRHRLTTLLPREEQGKILYTIFEYRLPHTKEPGERPSNIVASLDPDSILSPSVSQFLQESIDRFIQQFPDFPYERANVGNLIFASEYFRHGGSLMEATNAISKKVGLKPDQLLPVANADLDLKAEFEDGTVVYTEEGILQREMELGPTVKTLSFVKHGTEEQADRPVATKRVNEAIASADIITIGPGSVYTSFIPVLLSKGVVHALRKSTAPKILFVNIGAYSDISVRDEWLKEEHPSRKKVPASHIVRNILRHMQEADPSPSQNPKDYFDYVVVNSHRPDPRYIPVDVEHMKAMGLEVLMAPLENPEELGHHDPRQIAKVVMQLLDIEEHGYQIEKGTLRKKTTRSLATDGGEKNFLKIVEETLLKLNQDPHFQRKVDLAKQLERQGVKVRGGALSILLERIYIGPHVDISEFWDGVMDMGTRITGRSKIGRRSHLSGLINSSVIGENVKIIRGKEIDHSTIGNGSSLLSASISRYDIEDHVRIEDSYLSMRGKSTFGNGIEIAIGPEKERKPDLISDDRLTFKEIARIVMKRNDRLLLETHRRTAKEHANVLRSERGKVSQGATILRTKEIINAKIGEYAAIKNAEELHDVTVLSSRRYPSVINSGAIVSDTIVHEGTYIGERATVRNAIFMAHSGAKDNVVVEDAVIGPHSIMRFGHVVAFLAGPFVGKNHPSILIAGLWPGGMGNVGGHHTGSNHPSRGPTEEAYYPTAAFLGTNTDIIYPFSAETGILVGAGLVVPSQKILLPFSILTTPSISYNPRMNEILPGAGLTMTPYYYERVQYKNEEVNREKGTDIDTRIFTPEVINEMIRAVALLDRDPVSGKRITVEAVYTGEDYPGIGKNIMMEKSRGKAIEIYRFHISYYARKMLNARLEAIFETAPATWDEVKQELLLETDDEEWEYAKKLFERGIATWDKVFVIGLLEQFKEQENIYHVAVLHSKEKDEERRIGIFEVLDEAHIPFDRIPLVIKLKENHEATLRELGRLEERLLTLPVAGKDLPPSSNDGGTKSAPFVVALGGNAFEGETSDDQLPSLERMLEPVVELIKRGETVVITHGNGPQVGEGLLRIEIAAEKKEAPSMRLPYVGAQTQGSMGYMIASTLRRLLQKEGVPKEVVALITNVVVDTNDPAFQNPTKFIGKEYTKAETEQLSNERGWVFKEYKPGRWRRVVPSPLPREIVEEKIIQGLLEKGVIVVAAGGGGIPVSLRGLKGLDAVIDKDRTSALLAKRIGAEQFIILTAVDQVALDFGKPTQRAFSTLTMDEAKRYFAAGQFPAGSMGPKIEAAIDFLGNGGEKVIITDGQHLLEALEGKAGTTIVPTSKDGGTHLGLVEELLQKIARQRFTPIFGGAQARTIYLSEDLAIYDLQENTEVTLNHQTSPWAKAAKKRIKLVLRHLFGEDLSVGYGLESYRIAAALEDTYIDPFVILENVTLRIPKDGEEAVIHLRHAIVRERNDVFMVDILKELVQEGKLEEAMAKIEEVFRLDVWLIKEKRIVNLDLHFLKNTRIRNGRVVLRDLGYLTKDRDLALFFLTRLHQGGWEVAGGHPIEVTAQRLSHFAPPSLVNHYRTRAYEVYSIENFKHLWPDSDAFAHDDGSHFIEYQEVKHALRPMGIPIFEASEPVKGLIGLDEKGSVLWVDAFITQNSIPKALFDKILLPKLQFEKAIIEKGLPVAMEDEWVREVMALQPIGAGIVSLSEEEKEDLKNWIEARLLEGPREDLASLKELLSLNDVEEGTSRDGGGKGKWVTPEISPEIKKLLEEKVVSSIQIDSYTRIKNIVNPHGELQRGFYYASGGDAASFFLATNLTDALFVDFLPFGKEEGINDPLLLEWFLIDRTVWDSGFQRELSLRQLGGLKVPLLWDLVGMGAEIQGIRHIGRKTFEIHFNWAHPDDGKRIPRKITFFEKVDLIQPESYPKHLKKVLREGFDLYFMRGGGPLLQIGGLREGGYLVAPAGVVENNFWKEIDVPFGEGSFSIWEKKRGPAQDGGRRLLDLPRAGEFPLMQKPVEVGSGV